MRHDDRSEPDPAVGGVEPPRPDDPHPRAAASAPSHLEELIYAVLERRAEGEATALDELCRAHPEHADLLRARIAELVATGMLDEGDDLAPSLIPQRIGNLELVRRIGQGGMGVVYLARDEGLARDVAVKLLRPEHVYFEHAHERFRREVLSVARLSHPAIVPLHQFGGLASAAPGGLPYFTMGLVEGASLADTLRLLAGRDAATLTGKDLFLAVAAATRARGFEVPLDVVLGDAPLGAGTLADAPWLDVAAWVVREVASALEHAHQRRVLHRDVKPSNILLTPAGRVVLVDFGLASLQADDKLTRSQTQLGSLPYMAPEQVAGRAKDIDARTDVYGLGLLLYELATLLQPFRDGEVADLGARIAAGDIPPMRRGHRGVPQDFELVCRTAMEVDRGRRYPSAGAVANDLTNFLERRPITARPVGPWLALRRWRQRRPAAAVALGLGLATALAAPIAYGALEARSAVRIEAERDTARANLDAALEAVEVLLERVGHAELRDVPRLGRLRAELLTRATTLYERLEASSGGDPRTALRIATAVGKLAQLHEDQGEHEAALAAFADAEERFTNLAAARPDDVGVLVGRASLTTFTTLARHVGDAPTALARLAPAVDALRRARALSPATKPPRAELARTLLGVAHFLVASDRRDEAVERYVEVEALARDLIAEADVGTNDWTDAQQLLLTALGRRGSILYTQDEIEPAVELFEEVLAGVDAIAEPSAYARQLRTLAIQMLVRLRAEPDGADRDGRVDELMATAHEDALTLMRDYPQNVRYLSSVAHSHEALAQRAKRFGEHARAELETRECLRLHREASQRLPEEPEFARSVGLALGRLADMEAEQGDLALAQAHHREAIELFVATIARGGRQTLVGETLDAARRLMELAQQEGDGEALVAVAKQLPQWLPTSFPAAVDAAQAARFGGALLERAGVSTPERDEELREFAVAQLRRALELDATRRETIVRYARALQLEADVFQGD